MYFYSTLLFYKIIVKVTLCCQPFHFLLLIACWDLGVKAYSAVALSVIRTAEEHSKKN